MNIQVLDCTLRDGGYINNWNFGFSSIVNIISKLQHANVNIIELGFITKYTLNDENLSKFNSFSMLEKFRKIKNNQSIWVCMINYGEFVIEDVPNANDSLVDGIRVAFHKKDMINALHFSNLLIDKGYKVFIQPMVTSIYSDFEFFELIKSVNKIKPYAFYLVDSFGFMNEHNLKEMVIKANNALDSNIKLGFHSHNNLQLSFSNASAFISFNSGRDLIIDATLFGMGRGAGNLNIELIIDFLNKKSQKDHYLIEPVLELIDVIINPIFLNKRWGYSLPYYLSAKTNTHPNYATFLEDLNTLTVNDISIILTSIQYDKKVNFELDYIKQLYNDFQNSRKVFSAPNNQIRDLFSDRIILLLAPGRSIVDESDKIRRFIEQNKPVVISINFSTNQFETDYIFFANKRRFATSKFENHSKLILTSNIISNLPESITINYSDYLNNVNGVEDNAGLIFLKLLINVKPKLIYLAGFDGYDTNPYNLNFSIEPNSNNYQSIDRRKKINLGMNLLLNEYSREVNILFLTNPRFLTIFQKV